MELERKDIVIVGSGPAGVSTALSIHQLDPSLAEQTVVLDALEHPREKVCAGGVTGRALGLLDNLGVEVDVPYVPINKVRFRSAYGEITKGPDRYGIVARRSLFDGALASCLAARGIELRAGQRVMKLKRKAGRALVCLLDKTLSAKVVVGADGVGSVVRKFITSLRGVVDRSIQAEIPIDENHPAHAEGRIEFDFRDVAKGRKGYKWLFPYMDEEGRPHATVGICEWNEDNTVNSLRNRLSDYIRKEGLDLSHVKFRHFWERSFSPGGVYSAPNVLLAGESAGIDPFLGEGISHCVEYGRLVAQSIVGAFQTGNFAFEGHDARIKRSRLGGTLYMLNVLAKLFYGPLHSTMVKNGLLDEQTSKMFGDFLAGKLEPTPSLVFKIACRLGLNILNPHL